MANRKHVESIPVGPLAIVALSGSKALGETVDAYIADWRKTRIETNDSPITFKGYKKDSYLLKYSNPRFGTGESNTNEVIFKFDTSIKCSHKGYPCCSKNNIKVHYTDTDGEWGFENNQWCLRSWYL